MLDEDKWKDAKEKIKRDASAGVTDPEEKKQKETAAMREFSEQYAKKETKYLEGLKGKDAKNNRNNKQDMSRCGGGDGRGKTPEREQLDYARKKLDQSHLACYCNNKVEGKDPPKVPSRSEVETMAPKEPERPSPPPSNPDAGCPNGWFRDGGGLCSPKTFVGPGNGCDGDDILVNGVCRPRYPGGRDI